MTSNDANKVLNEGLGSSRRQSQKKPNSAWAGSQLWILKGERSGLSTRMATESVLSCERRNPDSISGSGTGDSPVCGEFIVVTLSPLSEIAVILLELAKIRSSHMMVHSKGALLLRRAPALCVLKSRD